MTSRALVLSHGQLGPPACDELSRGGFTTALASEERAALEAARRLRPDLVAVPVSELDDWYAVLRAIAAEQPGSPVLGLAQGAAATAEPPSERPELLTVVAVGAAPGELVARARAAVTRHIAATDRVQPAWLRESVAEAAAALAHCDEARRRATDGRAAVQLQESANEVAAVFVRTVGAVIAAGTAPGARGGHSRLVADLAGRMAVRLGWTGERTRGLVFAGLLCDAGMVELPEELLQAPGPLGANELALVQRHPTVSARVAEPLGVIGMSVAAVLAHHERLDGSGYPHGLRGRQIPAGAQLLAVADCFGAMTRPRPYRPARSRQDALAELDVEVARGRLAAGAVELLGDVLTEPPGKNPIG